MGEHEGMPTPCMGWEESQYVYDIDSAGKGNGKGFGKGKGKGDGSCHICAQFGHWSRECPSNPKGGGKGGKGFGKSWQGPSQFGFGKGGNGKGFGYQGTCFNCQQVGHKAEECTNARVAQVSEVGTEVQVGSVEVDAASSGNVWWMCCVEKEEVTNKPQP